MVVKARGMSAKPDDLDSVWAPNPKNAVKRVSIAMETH